MDTLRFASAELDKYMTAITGEKPEIVLSVDAGAFSGRFEKYDARFDDGYKIDIRESRGTIVGSNARACLLGVYAFLRAIGCKFLRPGKEGEVLPSLSPAQCTHILDFAARYRHRGIAIEGAVSAENILDMIAFAPKAGFNSYFMQFRNSYEFFERWYSHKNNPLLPRESFDADEIQRAALKAVKTRGLLYHAVGHGWTAEALHCGVRGWERKDDCTVDTALLAQVGGERGFFKGIPSNTNLCYSRPESLRLFSACVADYAEAHPEIDVLHVWLADDSKNFCECENCRNTLPSDFYVMLLNRIDEELTRRNIGTKIAFLAYCELLWAPRKNRIRNEDRFLLMFAPITRSYSEKFSEAVERSKHCAAEPYILNECTFPGELSRNLVFLREWKKVFGGDSFIFDYPLMWEVNKDISTVALSESIYDDVSSFAEVGLNGEVSCQLQRVFFPHGLNQSLMGRLLLGEDPGKNYVYDFLAASFGKEKAERVLPVMRLLRDEVPMRYFRYELPEVCFALAEKAENVRAEIGKLKEELASGRGGENGKLLYMWSVFAEYVLNALVPKMRGKDCSEQREKCLHYLQENEKAIQPYLDVCYAVTTLGEIFSFHWNAEIDERTDEVASGAFAKQIGESFVCDRQPVRLRYRNILPASLRVYTKDRFGGKKELYEEGRDYLFDYASGTLTRTEHSAMPDFSESPFYGLPRFNHNDFEKWGNGDFMLYADYRYSAKEISDAEYAREIGVKNGSFGKLKALCSSRCGKVLAVTVFGDSISFGCEATAEGNAYFYRFATALGRKFGIRAELCNRSVIGDTTDDALKRFDAAFASDASDIVLVAFGMNDQNQFGSDLPVPPEKFARNLRMIAEKLLGAGKLPVVITPCIPNGKWVYCSGRAEEYAAAAAGVAAEYDLPCADVYSLWKEQLRAGKKAEDLLNNGVNHPTDYGHFLYYLALKQLLGD